MNNKENYFAEVIESSLNSWTGQSWRWDTFPSFGSFVTIENKHRTIFGIVHEVQTGSMDPLRYPFPYQKTEDELLREQPQIFEFLKTTFSCVSLGYKEAHHIFHLVSPEPPKIHSFISYPEPHSIKEFLSNSHYLPMLFTYSSTIFNIDELILAVLKKYGIFNCLSKKELLEFMQTYFLLTGNDYRRIKLFLQRAEQVNKTLHIK